MAHNPKLAEQQGLDETTREVIDKLHMLRSLLELESNCRNTDITQKELYNIWFDNEKLLQKLWNFEDNSNFIKFWNFPACTCDRARMDQEERYPYGPYIMFKDCPIHGWE